MAANVATTLAAALKVFYIDGQNDQLNRMSVLYNKLAKTGQLDVTGKNYTYLLRTSRNTSAGTGMSEGGAFATAGNQGWTNTIIPNKYLNTSIEITGPAIRAAKNNVGAFVNAVKSEVDGATNDMIRAMNRQFHSDGSDALAFITASIDGTLSATSETVTDGQGNPFALFDPFGSITVDLVEHGSYPTLAGTALTLTPGAASASNIAVTVTGTVSGSTSGDFFVYSGTSGKQLMGIRGVIANTDPIGLTGGLHGLTVAANPYWVSQVFGSFTGSGGTLAPSVDLTLKGMQKPLTAITINSSFTAADVKFLMANGPIVDAYQALLVAEKRFVNEMELDGGQTALTYNNKPFIIDPQCRRNTIYYINPKTIDILTSSNGLQWADFLDGEQFKLKAGSSGYSDAYDAFLVFYGDMACKARNGNALFTGINE